MREATSSASTLYYFAADHLGSTSVTMDAYGTKIGEMKYMPFGETRYTWGGTPTDRRFTGQREENGLGSLYDYGARMYSPVLGRFISADTLVPSLSDPQQLNRYAYALNSPLNYTDPSGHAADAGGALCGSACWKAAYQNYLKYQQLADTAGDAYHGFLKEYASAQAAAYYNYSQQAPVQTLITSEGYAAASHNRLVVNGYYGQEAAVSAAADAGGLLAMPLMLISGLKELGAPALARGGVAPVLKGQAGVEKSIEAAIERGETVLGREVTIDTSGGRTRIDLVTTDGETIRLIEAKNGPTARLSPNQMSAFEALEVEGGIPRGVRAVEAGFTIGEPIPPAKVQVDWWK